MKREIKFRGQRVDNKEWVEGGFGILGEDTDLEKSVIIVSTLDTNSYVDRFYFTDVDVSRESVGQFTGLKDKNGVEIYEGDIVIEKSYPMYDNGLCNYRCVIVWDEEKAGFYLEMYVVSNRVRGCAVPDSISEYTELEVIGNIHDNPELLK